MSRFSPSEAALEGFRLIRRRPLTMAAWALVNALGVSLIGALMLVLLGGPFVEMLKKGGLEGLDPQKLATVLEQSSPAFLGIVVAVFLFSSVLVAGVYRVVLRPQERGFVHLRLGAVEVRLTIANLLMFLPAVVWFACINLVGAGVAAQHGLTAGVVAALVVLAPMVFVGVRLLMLTPMIFDTHRIDFSAAWNLTRGHFWTLFGMFLLSAFFYVLVWALIFVIHGLLVLAGGGPDAVYSLGKTGSPAALPILVIVIALEGILPVLQLVLLTGPLAVAYREITAEEDAPAAGAPAPAHDLS